MITDEFDGGADLQFVDDRFVIPSGSSNPSAFFNLHPGQTKLRILTDS
jgi:hypothetical protein